MLQCQLHSCDRDWMWLAKMNIITILCQLLLRKNILGNTILTIKESLMSLLSTLYSQYFWSPNVWDVPSHPQQFSNTTSCPTI